MQNLQRGFHEDVTNQHPLFVNNSNDNYILQIAQPTIDLCQPMIIRTVNLTVGVGDLSRPNDSQIDKGNTLTYSVGQVDFKDSPDYIREASTLPPLSNS